MAHKNCATKTENTPRTKRVQTRSRADHVDRKWLDAEIYRLHITGKSNLEIADALGCHRNKVSSVVRSYTPPTTEEVLNDFKRLDPKAIGVLQAAMDCGDFKYSLPAAQFYLSRRNILGETDKPLEVNLNVVAERRNTRLRNGLAAYGFVHQNRMSGDN